MSKKQFRLLKDAPDVDADAIFTFNFSGNWCHYVTVGKSGKDVEYDQSYVENAKDWFEEVLPVSEPVPYKIEVMNFVGRKKYTDERCTDTIYEFNSTRQIPLDRFPAIKQAIESALNDTVDLEMYKLVRDNEALKSLNEQLCSHIDSLNKKIQTPLNDTVLEDKNMSTVYFDKQVLNPHAQGTQAYTNWEQGFYGSCKQIF